MRTKLRRLRFGLETLLLRPKGFFSPYRYAASVDPAVYPELVPAFEAAHPAMEDLLDQIAEHAPTLSAFAGPPPQPRWDQAWFPRLDGAAAYATVREHRPNRIVEVGSGHSTRFLARAAQDAVEGAGLAQITCIDPAPRAALKGLPVTWRGRVLGPDDLPLFQALDPDDVAFFDSSHLLWPGSDVDLILNRILPVLKPGVLIHIHDITLPDPYPEAWDWRGYTEQLGVAPWILGGGAELLWSSHYARTRLGAAARPGVASLPLVDNTPETSLWLRRR